MSSKKPNPRRANSTRRNKVRQRLKAQGRPCAVCGKPIDYDLPAGHKWSFEVDEIVPIRAGGSPYAMDNVQPVHRVCNRLKYQREMAEAKKRKQKPPNAAQASCDW